MLTPAGTWPRSASQYAAAVAASGAGGATMTFTSVVPVLNVQTRSWSTRELTPAPSFAPTAPDASSWVRRLHGSIDVGLADGPAAISLGGGSADAEAAVLGLSIGTALAARLATEMGEAGAAVGAVEAAVDVEHAASATLRAVSRARTRDERMEPFSLARGGRGRPGPASCRRPSSRPSSSRAPGPRTSGTRGRSG